MTKLYLEDIHAAYQKKEILRGISLAVPAGQIATLIGPNGAGKSTLLKVIAGMLKPSKGKISLADQEITGDPLHKRAGYGVAYCMQGSKVFPSLSVRENLEISSRLLSTGEVSSAIATMLGVFTNLKSLLNKRAGFLSGGERQALAIAMAFIRRPRLLLLDEPSAGLSPKLVQDTLLKVQEFNVAQYTTVLLVEQNVQEALKIAHCAFALVNGKIALATATPKEWLTGNQLEQLFLDLKQA